MSAFIVPDTVWWVCDAGRVLVVDEVGRTNYSLSGIEAVIWDSLTQGYTGHKIRDRLVALLRVTPADAGEILAAALYGWLQAGLVCELTHG